MISHYRAFPFAILLYIFPEVEEAGVQQVFADHNFYYPVKVTTVERPPLVGFPWIRPSDFIRSLHKTNDLSHLLGGHNLEAARPMLLSFWEKYRAVYPKHQLWDHLSATKKDIAKCIPLYIHGDEGTSFKRGGILILSFQGVIGFGTSKSAKLGKEHLRAMDEGIPMNFLKTGLQTRMLICTCPKDWTLAKHGFVQASK